MAKHAGMAALGVLTGYGLLEARAETRKPPQCKIPMLGFGTAALGDKAEEAILCALKSGYRHLDTALLYHSHKPVGEALRKSGLKRSDVWITTKVAFYPPGFAAWMKPPKLPPFIDENVKGKEREALDRSLKEMNVDYVDLCLIHTPCTSTLELWTAFLPHAWGLVGLVPLFVVKGFMALASPFLRSPGYEARKASWEALERLQEEGKCRAIGVSNYEVKHLEEMLTYAKVLPAVNQIEMHPKYPREDVVRWCHDHGIAVTAYGHHVCIDDLQKKYPAESASPLLLRWITERGVTVVPRSQNPDHIKENATITVPLKPEQRDAIAAISSDQPHYWNTSVCPAKAS